MNLLLSLLLIAAMIAFFNPTVSSEDIQRFDNYKVYNVYIEDENQLKTFSKLNTKYPIHIIQEGGENSLPYYLALNPVEQNAFEKDLLNAHISFELMNDNLQELIDRRQKPNERTFSDTTMDWTQYHELSTINAWIKQLAWQHSYIRKHFVGLSAQARPMYALQLSKKRNNKAIFIESNIHAIEWISSAVSTCFLNYMVNINGTLLDKYDFVFLPMLNPDGFQYSKTHPLWRKNRRFNGHFNESGPCYGVDMNRNYNSYWKQAGYNVDVPCDHWYGGNSPESEPEIQAAIRFEKSFPKGYIRMHLAMHSYGQMLLLPYGHSNTAVPSNYQQMAEISSAFVQAAKVRYGTSYIYGPSGQVLAPVSGASKDYWYDYGIKYSATLELRDRGQYGFFLPPEFIQPTCDEVIDGLYALFAAAQARGIFD